jgi:chaperonin cofactor prefoldin
MERAIESDRKRFTKLEVHISSLYAVQNKMEQAIRLIDDKINAIVLSGGGSGGGLTLLTAEQAEILHTPIPNFTVNDDEVGPLPAARASRASVSESPKLNAMKSNLKEKRKESLRAPRSSIVSPLGQPTPILEVDEYADQSVDSQVLMDEWVVDKLELLDSIVNDQIIGRLNTQDTHRKNIDSQLHTLQETLKEMELSNDGSKAKGVSTVEYDHLKHTDKAFRAIVHEVKESWEKAYEELDKKVQKMEYIIKQIESSPDDLHKRLNSFKSKMRSLLDSLEDTNGESKDELLARLSRPLDDISREAAEISRIELELRDNVSKKAPGTPLPPSATPSRLPEHLKVAQKKSTAFIDEGIEKLTLSNRIHHLEEAIHSKVNVTSLNQLDEDLRIALTLKTDQKAFDSAIIKKASQVDLQKFREHVADEIDSMREMLVRNASSAHKMMSSMTAAPQTDGDLAERFDILYSQFQELKKGVAALVPRSEVEVALQALLDEVKAARKVFIDKESFNDRLKKKADQSELER